MFIEKILAESARQIGAELIDKVSQTIDETPIIENNEPVERIVLAGTNPNGAPSDDQPISHQNKTLHGLHSVPPEDHIGLINAYSRNRRLNIMVTSAAIGLGLCLLILTLCRANISGEVIGIVSTIAGIFGACLKDAYSFEFGSSRGSHEKDARLSAALFRKLK